MASGAATGGAHNNGGVQDSVTAAINRAQASYLSILIRNDLSILIFLIYFIYLHIYIRVIRIIRVTLLGLLGLLGLLDKGYIFSLSLCIYPINLSIYFLNIYIIYIIFSVSIQFKADINEARHASSQVLSRMKDAGPTRFCVVRDNQSWSIARNKKTRVIVSGILLEKRSLDHYYPEKKLKPPSRVSSTAKSRLITQ
jgi:hypothetical protein